MSSVLSRTCFYEIVGGTWRPFEWSLINDSTLGPMVEPFWPFPTSNNTNDDFSSSSDFQRVDEFVQVSDDVGMLRAINCGNQGPWLHGGRHYPRSGR